ncbi:MAG: aminopeptidase, partial [Bryobacteraceae bacterium]
GYHDVGDEWQKIDYGNMARVDRMAAVGLLMLAGNGPPPEWNPHNAKASKYLDAWEKLHPAR